MIRPIVTPSAPPPAGTYSQAMEASGTFLFLSGQTPRLPDGTRLKDRPFEEDIHQVMRNLTAVAEAAGYNLKTDCVKVLAYLTDLSNKAVFDRVYAEYIGNPPPARSVVQSSFTDFSVEVEAILVR
ncbi:enamine deaminase RidA [Azorhizobium oxalatiphilum]|uniref:Enamine deaminase RidA n=1 Tax=Azorhizobium oxalatiphilum TaxID=980631 RepID=A0A917BQC1_9HYPH|nr:Rid family hydrolase [Azorhizobium oxalatiphilum]GGF50485.1 enamine deaminase RidA [Azorhizobium oxalatiphilum]